MAGLPDISGVCRVVVQGTSQGGGFWQNTWHFRYSGGASIPGPTEIDALDAVFKVMYGGPPAAGNSVIMTYVNTSQSVQTATYTVLWQNAFSIVKSWGTVGANAGTGLPPQTSLVATIRTSKRGRRYRGRIYLPAFTTNFDVGGAFTATEQPKLNNQFTKTLFTDLAPTQWKLGVASYGRSYTKYKDPNTKIITWTPTTWTPEFTEATTCLVVDTKYDTQRRRVR